MNAVAPSFLHAVDRAPAVRPRESEAHVGPKLHHLGVADASGRLPELVPLRGVRLVPEATSNGPLLGPEINATEWALAMHQNELDGLLDAGAVLVELVPDDVLVFLGPVSPASYQDSDLSQCPYLTGPSLTPPNRTGPWFYCSIP